ncbi:hypothetical protein [Helicobacter sp. 13S00477-4]|uniref:hypothetical protein n=1 Tax=Helicobacter sp. 13S00477-4 TaxID=1905759 RepID=UPI000BA7DA81|nr:hypothetical protein [Helicobacter sp. 13S00477-4]PAF50499.1 hypothetical protein BKH44_08060 [Helicobacter sp. 13S00477-4]
MSYISSFIKQYQSIQNNLAPQFTSDIKGLLKEISYKIMDEKFSPSVELKLALKNLNKKIKEPLKVMIIGGKDSSKATFINTILKSHVLPNTQMYSQKEYNISYGYTKSIIAYHKDKTSSGLNTLSLNTLTQEELNKINYFEIKSPKPIFKEINLCKYPDIELNNEESFTSSIEKIKQADILIWLNRVDDLANAEELNALKPYIAQKSSLSLCLITHIDILEKSEDIIPVLNFAKEHFGEMFKDILPISPIILSKELGIDEEFFLQKQLQKLFCDYSAFKSQDMKKHKNLLIKGFKESIQNISTFYKNIPSIPQELQNQEINFNAIFERLNLELIPLAKKQKEDSIKKQLLHIVEKIKKNYEGLIQNYSKLLTLLQYQTNLLLENITNSKEKILQELDIFFKSLESDHNNIIDSILNNIKPEKTKILLQNDGSISQLFIKKTKNFTTYKIDSQTIYQELLDTKSKPYRIYKALNYKFLKLASSIALIFEKNANAFNIELKKWQIQNEFIKKRESILSDSNYNNLRIFASKIYENITLDFIECLFEANEEIQMLFCKINTQIESTRKLCIKYTLSVLFERFYNDCQNASFHPAQKSLPPTKNEISQSINQTFSINEFKNTLLYKDDSLIEIFENLSKNITQIQKEKIILIQKNIQELRLLLTTINQAHESIFLKQNNG